MTNAYYVDPTLGSDANTGLSPAAAWKTIKKVNAVTANPTYPRLFKRSETWRETLTVPADDLTFGSYGVGTKPRILGSKKIATWTHADIDSYAGDVLNESFEQEVDYDSTSWIETLGDGSLLDKQSSEVAPPGAGGSQVLKVQKVSPNFEARAQWDRDPDTGVELPTTYFNGYVNVHESDIAPGQHLNLITGVQTTGSTVWAVMLGNNSGTLRWEFYLYNDGALTLAAVATPVSLDTWYKHSVKYDHTTHTFQWLVDDVESASGSLTGVHYDGIRGFHLGDIAYSQTLTAYYDLIKVDTASFTPFYHCVMPADCWWAACTGLPVLCFFEHSNDTASWGKKETALVDVDTEYDYYWDTHGFLIVYAPASPDTRYASVENPLRANGVDANSKSYVTLQDLELAYSINQGLKNQNQISHHWTVERNTVHHIGIIAAPSACGITNRASHSIIRHNIVHDCGTHGICVNSVAGFGDVVQDVLVEDNEVYDCYHTGIDVMNISGSLDHVTVQFNKLYTTAAYAHPTIYSHLLFLQGVNGIMLNYVNYYYNICFNAMGIGLLIGDYTDYINVFNNVFCGINPLYPYTAGRGLSINANVDHVVVKNNAGLDAQDVVFQVNDMTKVTVDYNCWYNTVGVRQWVLVDYNAYHFDDLAAYKAATGFDTHGVWNNPRFSDPVAHDFTLRTTSQLIAAGLDVGLTLDFAGLTLGSPPCIGAHERIIMTLSTLDLLTARLLLILGDVSANRFTSAITDEAFRLALAEYSYAVPNLITATHTVTVPGREQALPSDSTDIAVVVFPGLIAVTMILYPWTDDSFELDPLQRYYYYFTDGQPTVYVGGQRTPAVGDQLRITYAASQTIDDLNDADACTVPVHDFELLLMGAAGHAARLRSSIYNESFSNHPELKAFGIDSLNQFRATLRSLSRQASRQPLPAAGFKFDQWDGT